MAEAEQANPSLPTTNITQPKQGKKKRTFLRSIFWMLFFLGFFATTALILYDYTLRDSLKLPPVVEQKKEDVIVAENPAVIVGDEIKKEELVEEEVIAAAPVEQKPDVTKEEVVALSGKVSELENQNKNIFIYFIARDLKDSVEDKENFSSNLQHLRALIGDNPEVSGKIDILEQAVQSNYESQAKLRSDLKLVEKKVEDANRGSLSENIGNMFGQLVKVSKVEGEVKDADYKSIIKRADIILAKDNLSFADMQKVIGEMSKLGKPAEDWLRRANNLQRVIEVTDYLVEYSKSKVTGI